MKSRHRLADLPYLAATLAMALALILPWAFTSPVEEQAVEIGMIFPWAVPASLSDLPGGADHGAVQLASQVGATEQP